MKNIPEQKIDPEKEGIGMKYLPARPSKTVRTSPDGRPSSNIPYNTGTTPTNRRQDAVKVRL